MNQNESNWRKATLPPSVSPLSDFISLAARTRSAIIERYVHANKPEGFCVFVAYAPDLTYYFSPVAVTHCSDLLDAIGAVETEAPSPDLTMLNVDIGDSACCHGLLKSRKENGYK